MGVRSKFRRNWCFSDGEVQRLQIRFKRRCATGCTTISPDQLSELLKELRPDGRLWDVASTRPHGHTAAIDPLASQTLSLVILWRYAVTDVLTTELSKGRVDSGFDFPNFIRLM